MNTDILWLAKRLKDIGKDIDRLSPKEKTDLVERLAIISDETTHELYSTMNQLMYYMGIHNQKDEEDNIELQQPTI